LAWALLEAGDLERAARTAAEAVERGRKQGYTLALVDALRIQGMVRARQDKKADAEQAFGEAVRLAQGMPYPFAEGQALLEWGLTELARGQRSEAHHQLEAALANFGRLGAKPSIKRLEQERAQVGLSGT
jgi:tetratricopeptide (TPR) repeat protein